MGYRIGKLADQCSVNKETIRYYERVGLIPQPPRNDSGYRSYPESVVQRVHFIKRMQDLGFTLKEINRLLEVVDRDEARCQNMYEFTVAKIEEIEQKIPDLMRVKSVLYDLKERCPNEKDLYECPIIDAVMEQ